MCNMQKEQVIKTKLNTQYQVHKIKPSGYRDTQIYNETCATKIGWDFTGMCVHLHNMLASFPCSTGSNHSDCAMLVYLFEVEEAESSYLLFLSMPRWPSSPSGSGPLSTQITNLSSQKQSWTLGHSFFAWVVQCGTKVLLAHMQLLEHFILLALDSAL